MAELHEAEGEAKSRSWRTEMSRGMEGLFPPALIG